MVFHVEGFMQEISMMFQEGPNEIEPAGGKASWSSSSGSDGWGSAGAEGAAERGEEVADPGRTFDSF